MKTLTGKAVLLIMAICATALTQPVSIGESARAIQCDGFLIEWKEQQGRPCAGSSAVVWDAVQTPEGVAGYVHAKGTPASALKTVLLAREDEIDSIELAVPGQGVSCCPFHAVQVDSSRQETVVEFLLTWQRLGSTAQAGAYRFHVEALDSSGKQIAIARFGGPATTTGSLVSQVFTTKVKIQLALIALLLAAYAGLMIWVRKMRTRRTQSPHQSA